MCCLLRICYQTWLHLKTGQSRKADWDSAHLWMILKMGHTYLYDIIHLLNCAHGRHSARLKKIVEMLNEVHLLRQVENSYNIEHILPHLLWRYPKVHWNTYTEAGVLLDAHLFELWSSTQSPKYLKQSVFAKWNLVNVSIVGGKWWKRWASSSSFCLEAFLPLWLGVSGAVDVVSALIYLGWVLSTPSIPHLVCLVFLTGMGLFAFLQ